MLTHGKIAAAIGVLILCIAVQAWAQGASTPASPSPSPAKAFQSSGIKVSVGNVNVSFVDPNYPRVNLQLAIQNTRNEGLFLSILKLTSASDDTGTNYVLQGVSGFSQCGYSIAIQSSIESCHRNELNSFDGYTFIDPGQVAVAGLTYAGTGAAPSRRVPDTISFVLSIFALLGTGQTDVLDPIKAKGNPGRPKIVTISFPLIPVK